MPQQDLVGRTIAGYRLLERVGEGGTAEVYRAEHPEHGVCAFKLLRPPLEGDPTAVERFLREAGYGARVHHPGVVRTYDYGESEGRHYLALEWAAGVPLADVLPSSAPLAPHTAVPLVHQLAAALTAAHRAGIVHRDLKPENIMLDPASGTTKLLDFGIARDAALDPGERLTRTGYFVGSLRYVAPEALSGELVDERADLYSLATIAYYMLTGAHPFRGGSPRVLFQQLLTSDPIPLRQAAPSSGCTTELERVVMRGLARDPAARPPDVETFAAALDAAARAPAEPRGLLGTMKQFLKRS
jgi:serine/threonine-protein kinase